MDAGRLESEIERRLDPERASLIIGRSSDPDHLRIEALGRMRDDDPDALDAFVAIQAGPFRGQVAATLRRAELGLFRRACEDIARDRAVHAELATEEEELTLAIDVTTFGALRVSGTIRDRGRDASVLSFVLATDLHLADILQVARQLGNLEAKFAAP